MNRRDFIENTALGAVMAPILAVFGVEPGDSSENGGNWADFARNHPDPPDYSGHVRIIDDSGHRIEVEVPVVRSKSGGIASSSASGLPTPSYHMIAESERFRVGSLQEFETEYLLRVGSRPEDVDLYRVANALGVDPV